MRLCEPAFPAPLPSSLRREGGEEGGGAGECTNPNWAKAAGARARGRARGAPGMDGQLRGAGAGSTGGAAPAKLRHDPALCDDLVKSPRYYCTCISPPDSKGFQFRDVYDGNTLSTKVI